jgi:hypothetical protein
MYSIIPYNLFVGGLCIYYTVNFKKFSKKFFKPRNYSSWELFKFGIIYKRFEGTIQASVFVVAYFSGKI